MIKILTAITPKKAVSLKKIDGHDQILAIKKPKPYVIGSVTLEIYEWNQTTQKAIGIRMRFMAFDMSIRLYIENAPRSEA